MAGHGTNKSGIKKTKGRRNGIPKTKGRAKKVPVNVELRKASKKESFMGARR